MSMILDGSNGVTFPDATSQSSAPIQLGVGQTLQDVTASRAQSTTYTNTTGKPIIVYIKHISPTGGPAAVLTINGSAVSGGSYSSAGPVQAIATAVIPAGGTYSLSGASTLNSWWELR